MAQELPPPSTDQPSQPPPSPSPPPQKPTPLTPGPRAQALLTLYNKTLSATLNSISYGAFSACFPHIAAHAPAALKAFHANFIKRLEGYAKEQFESLLEEREVVRRLNELEGLIGEARARRGQAVDKDEMIEAPTEMEAERLMEGYLRDVLVSERGALNARLQTVESLNAGLILRVQEQRKEMEELRGVLQKIVGDLEGAGREVGSQGEELAGEGREVEMVLNGFGNEGAAS
ncbi:hypothetical protein B0J14DRAFT_567346 [Halenospora varia]|nr:hypothetical protein B0J14DRAFT_567346 [Halenospora varia]